MRSSWQNDVFNYRYHWHEDEYELNILLHGRQECCRGSENFHLDVDDVILVPPGVGHASMGSQVDIANQSAVKEPFRFHPKILAGFFPVAFGVGDNGIYQLQNVFLAADIHKGVISHGFLEVYRIQHFYLVAAALQELSALD